MPDLPQLQQAPAWDDLNGAIIGCARCRRLRDYCADVARTKRRAYQDCGYWGRPVPNFGDPAASILVVGLAPGAHGANRTGRMFTGDESGRWLFRSLHQVGLASQPDSTSADDGLCLHRVAITAAAHCAPPENRPTADEFTNCRHWLQETLRAVDWSVLVVLGRLAFEQTRYCLKTMGIAPPKCGLFAHGAVASFGDGRWLVCSYHPSQQNTFTGKLTHVMLVDVFETALRLSEQPD